MTYIYSYIAWDFPRGILKKTTSGFRFSRHRLGTYYDLIYNVWSHECTFGF